MQRITLTLALIIALLTACGKAPFGEPMVMYDENNCAYLVSPFSSLLDNNLYSIDKVGLYRQDTRITPGRCVAIIGDEKPGCVFHRWIILDNSLMAIIEDNKGLISLVPFHKIRFIT